MRRTITTYTRLLVSPARAALRALQEVTFQIFFAAAAPTAFGCAIDAEIIAGLPSGAESFPSCAGPCASWAALDDALETLPALEAVKFLLCDVEGSDAFYTVGEMRWILEQQLPRMWRTGRVQVLLEEMPEGEDELDWSYG